MDELTVEVLGGALDCFWLFFGGVLVFFMQAGFTLVEAGFTRAKNTGNIIMKNVVDFMFGSIIYWCIGYGIMHGADVGSFVGKPFGETFLNGMAGLVGQNPDFNYTALFFQTVFCATSATIVSGAMAERTNFKAYCIYSALISLVIYPVAGHWVWGASGEGWLQTFGFHDFAGSAIVHMLGGTLAFVGAAILGPRIGKYTKDGRANAIPGHNIALGAAGVFILWFGWFGFNPASSGGLTGGGVDVAAKVFITTNLAACSAAVAAMFFTWFRYGKPDVSMTLNGILAGLVAITAPCAVVSPFEAIIIGAIGGILLCIAVPFIDTKLKVDDPVGAVSVHGVCGFWGTIAVGLFANEPDLGVVGLFHGNAAQLGVQALGAVALLAWAAILGSILFGILKKANLLRCSKEDEITGLDITEHGLESAYPDFVMTKN